MVSRKYLLFIDTLYYIKRLLLAAKYNIRLQGSKVNFFPKSIFFLVFQNQHFSTKTNTAKPRVWDLVHAYEYPTSNMLE
jgi:hypothetical protein